MPVRRPDPDYHTDELLLAGLAAGDEVLGLAFVRRFQRVVYGIALTVLSDQGLAEDVAQQAFERAWRSAALYDPRRGSVRTWLSSIVHNLAVDVIRSRRPTPIDPMDLHTLIGAMTDRPEHRALADESAGRLSRALVLLPVEQARAVVLAGVHGLTAREIAEAEDIPLGTAKSRIRSAMAKLRDALANDWIDND